MWIQWNDLRFLQTRKPTRDTPIHRFSTLNIKTKMTKKKRIHRQLFKVHDSHRQQWSTLWRRKLYLLNLISSGVLYQSFCIASEDRKHPQRNTLKNLFSSSLMSSWGHLAKDATYPPTVTQRDESVAEQLYFPNLMAFRSSYWLIVPYLGRDRTK